MASNDKLIKELLINVKQKGLTTVNKDLQKLQDNFENASAGSELLNETLQKLPGSLREIVQEAQKLESSLKDIRIPGLDSIDNSLMELNEGMNDLIGTMVEMQETMTKNFTNSTNNADASLRELLVTLERMGVDMEVVSRAMKQTSKSTDSMSNSQKKLNNRMKDTSRRGNNFTRLFSDMASVAGPIPVLYAQIAANVFVLDTALRNLTEGAQLNRLEQLGTVMGTSIGVPIQSIARDMQEATGYTITYQEALKQASSAATFGYTAKQIEEMTKVARRASVALGVDMTDALNRVTRGVSKQEIEILDDLGITIRLNEAYSAYAKQLNISATALNSYQKQQAYLNAVLKQSELRQAKVDPYLQANGWEALTAEIKALVAEGQQYISKFLDPAANLIANIFKDNNATKASKSVAENIDLLKASLTTDSKGDLIASLANNLAKDGGVADKVAELNNRAKQLEITIDNLSKRSSSDPIYDAFGGNATGQLLADAKAEYEEITDLLRRYNIAVINAKSNLSSFEKANLDAIKGIYMDANAFKNSAQSFSDAESAIRGTAQSYELVGKYATEMNDILDRGKSFTQEQVELFKAMGLSSEEAVAHINNLAKASERSYKLAAELETTKAKIMQEGNMSGDTAAAITLKQNEATRKSLLAQLATLKEAKANESALIPIRQQLAALSISDIDLIRTQKNEVISIAAAEAELIINRRQFNNGVYTTTSEYTTQQSLLSAQIESTKALLANLASGNARTADRVALEQKLLDLEKQKAQVAASRIEQDARYQMQLESITNTAPGGTGEIADAQNKANTLLAMREELVKKNLISDTQLRDLDLEIAQAKQDALTKEITSQAALSNLFMARTDQQSTATMTAEQELAYQQQIGASIYENARNALSANDEAMGSMFDQLQNFATALTQVGKSSQSVWNTVGSGIQAVASIMSYSSQKAMGDIDSQIEAEKKRDGKSEESQKKIAKLEAKKRAENLKAQRQAIIANTAVGIMSAISTAGNIYAGLALAAVVAAMGITQLSALDSGSIAQADSSDPTKLELGSRQNSIDVSKSANAGELSYIRGDKGTGSIQDFIPRARGSNMNPNVKYVTGEHGTEVVATSLQGKKVTNTEGLDNSNSNSNSGAPISLTIQAMDSQSIIDRSEDIFNSLEVAAKARGYTLSRLSNI